ncbi:hypothetical protein Leryth_001294 [Lithospermum erythrorhizon]|nr:hypothetical protein Leryth_001294 [Lithospermum erythrorhizon]
MEPKTPSKSKNQAMLRVKNYRVLKISIALMIILLLLVGGYLIYDPNGVQYVSRRGSRCYYTVVVDCGSTGTRVNVYEWLMEDGSKSSKRNLPVLMHMYPDNVRKSESCRYHCMQTEPGLHKFVGNATGVRGSVEPLIHWAEQWVPVGRRSDTPIFVLATAGMRRLVEDDARRILQDVEGVVKQHGFMHRKSWIRVLSGREEAYYGWVALNYKMGVLGSSSRKSTLGLLDLGGSSLQLVAETDGPSEGEHILESQVGASKHHLLAYSLPAFGLNKAFDRTVVMLSHGHSLAENADNAFEVRHPCLGSGFSRNYTCNDCFGTHSTTSKNSKNDLSSIFLLGNPDWDICKALVRAAAINASNLELSHGGQNSSCNGLSSYRGNKLLILTKASRSVSRYHALSAFFAVYSMFNLGPSANVTSMWERGQQLCSAAWVNKTIPHGGLYCFRAAYITSLIEDVLCLSSYSEILFGPGDISWTLGAALVEGDYLWIDYTNTRTNWRLLPLNFKEMMMSSPFIIFVLLCCLLVIVYYSQVMLPMPGTRRKGVIGTAGRSSSLPSFLGPKHQP